MSARSHVETMPGLRGAAERRVLALEAEVERLQEELRRAEGRIEQRYANEQVRQLRRTGYCPCCGAEA